jgi:hypothetical protein
LEKLDFNQVGEDKQGKYGKCEYRKVVECLLKMISNQNRAEVAKMAKMVKFTMVMVCIPLIKSPK